MAEQSPDSAPSVLERLAANLEPEAAPEAASEAEPIVETPEAEAPEDDSEDFDLDGSSTVRVAKELKPKLQELKDGYLRREDYTRKTQELADLTRQAQALAETVNLRQAFDEAVKDQKEELAGVNFELRQYKQIDLSTLDENTYRRYKDRIETLKDKADDLKKGIDGKNGEFSRKIEEHKSKAVAEAVNYLQKTIPNFNKSTIEGANEGAYSVGYTTDELQRILDARFVHLAWKAFQFDKLQSGKSAAVASVQKAPPIVKPGAGLGPGVAAEGKYREIRAAQRKSGSVEDTARLLMLRGSK